MTGVLCKLNRVSGVYYTGTSGESGTEVDEGDFQGRVESPETLLYDKGSVVC